MSDGRTLAERLEDLAYSLVGEGREEEAEAVRMAQAVVEAAELLRRIEREGGEGR